MSSLSTRSSIGNSCQVVVGILICWLGLPNWILAQNPVPKLDQTSAIKSFGVADVLQGKFDPAGRLRKSPTPNRKQATPGIADGRVTLEIEQQIANVKQRIDRLTAKPLTRFSGIPTVDSLAKTVRQLRETRQQLIQNYDQKRNSFMHGAGVEILATEKKWTALAKTVSEGKRRSREEWLQLIALAKEKSKPGTGPAESSDRIKGNDTFDWSIPEFAETARVFRAERRPSRVPSALWVQLQDRFERDVARIQVSVASAKMVWTYWRKRHLDSLNKAIATAESQLEKLKTEPPVDKGNQLAAWSWQRKRTELSRLNQLLKQLLAIQDPPAGLDPIPLITPRPLSPIETIGQVARTIETSNRPPAPEKGAFDKFDPLQLIRLYPEADLILEKKLVDPNEHFVKVLKNRAARFRELIEIRSAELNELKKETSPSRETQKSLESQIAELKTRLAAVEERMR